MEEKSIDDYLSEIKSGMKDDRENPPTIETKSVLEGANADSIITTRTEHFTQSAEVREEKKHKPEKD